MKLSRYFAVLLVVLPLPLACGGSSDGSDGSGGSGGGGGGGSTPIERADAPALFADLLCTNVGPCCEAAGRDYKPAACKQIYLGELTAQWDVPNTIWDADAAGRCFSQAREALASCATIPGNACEGVLIGTLAEGAACTHSAQCVVPPGGEAHCYEVCEQQPRGKAGDPCGETCTVGDDTKDCSSGGGSGGGPVGPAICFTNDGLYCAESGKCEALLNAGEACSSDGCVAGNFCAGVCTPALAPGVRCSRPDQCGTDGFCDSTTNVCVAKKPKGADCVEYDECQAGYCNNDNKCLPNNPATEETCSGL